MILMLLAALSVPVVGRSSDAIRSRAEVAGFSAVLRRARERAITSRQSHTVVIDPPNHKVTVLAGPDGEVRETRPLPERLTVEATPPPALSVRFEPEGTSSGADTSIAGSPRPSNGLRLRTSIAGSPRPSNGLRLRTSIAGSPRPSNGLRLRTSIAGSPRPSNGLRLRTSTQIDRALRLSAGHDSEPGPTQYPEATGLTGGPAAPATSSQPGACAVDPASRCSRC